MQLVTRHHLAGLVVFLLLTFFLARPAGTGARAQSPVDPPIIARVTVGSQAELGRLLKRGLDLVEAREGNDLFIVTTQAQIDELRREGWVVRVDQHQSALLRAPTQNLFLGGYRTVSEMRALLDDAASRYPNLAEVFVYGSSWEKTAGVGGGGHDLFGIRLTNRQRPGPKPTFFLMAAIHARELSTSELALRLIDYLLSGYGVDGDATWLLDEHQIVIVPVANPDGHVIAEQGYYQRKNTDTAYGGNCANPATVWSQFGVDLNRNSSFKWGTVDGPDTDRCAQTYPGPAEASEPETAALQNLVRSLFPDQRGPLDTDAAPGTATGVMITLHSYGDLVLWPWGWTGAATPNDAGLSAIGRRLAGYNGFTPQQSIQLYPTSGTTDDWAYGELGIAAFTFEVGQPSGTCGGFFPAFSCLDGGTGGSFWGRNLPAFLYAARIARAPYQLGQGPSPESLTATTGSGGSVQLQAQFDESLNGGRAVIAAEYYIDTPPWRGGIAHPMSPADGSFNSVSEAAAAVIGPIGGGHLVYVRAQDVSGHWGPVRAAFTPDTACTFNLAPLGQNFAGGGGTGSLNVTASSLCDWTAVSNNPGFITVTMGSRGAGNGTVTFTVSANPGATTRAGTLTVARQSFTVLQAAEGQFFDVPLTHPFSAEISKIALRGITGGCGDGNYCPDQAVTREQMAIFLIRALGEFNPPIPGTQRFFDVLPSRPGYAFIDQMAVRQITAGCGGGNYCPDTPVTREQVAIFILRALGVTNPPAPTTPHFSDVPASRFSYPFIEEMAARGITSGCDSNNYCPDAPVTRGQMAVFLVRAFGL